ncbi:MAG: hypothetical protein BWY31_03568 [Lentisphaerae bacterium ADurb.Bin242]|nr:MAG: hypothetical protein BWY31_03568 [Lentisphaerae bacterium ADurb.Bin242]
MNTACAACLETAMNIPEKELPLYEENLIRRLDGIAAFARKADWKDFTWTVHMEDESEFKYRGLREKSDRIIRRMSDFIRMKYPVFRRETANPYIPRLRGSFNLWTVLIRDYPKITPAEWDAIRKDGDGVWAYVCCEPHAPFANFFVDQEGAVPRVLFWQLFKHRIDGLLYYSVNAVRRQENSDLPGPK